MAEQSKQACSTWDTPTSLMRDVAQFRGVPLEPLSGIDTNSCRLAAAQQVAKDLGLLLSELNYAKNIASVFGLEKSYPFETLRTEALLNEAKAKLEKSSLFEREKLAMKFFFLGESLSISDSTKLFVKPDMPAALRKFGLAEEVSGKVGEKASSIRMRDVQLTSVRGLADTPIYLLTDSPAVLRKSGVPKAVIYLSAELLLRATYDYVEATGPLDGKTVVDFGSGIGIQGIAIARAFPGVGKVHLVDIEPRAMRFSLFNGAMNGVSDKIELVDNASSVKDPLGNALKGKKIDLMISNPPYNLVPTKFERQFTNFGNGGPDGTRLSRLFVDQTRPHLAPTGDILMTGEFAYSGDAANPRWKLTEGLKKSNSNSPLYSRIQRNSNSKAQSPKEYGEWFSNIGKELADSFGSASAPKFDSAPEAVARFVEQDLKENGVDGVAFAVARFSFSEVRLLDLGRLQKLVAPDLLKNSEGGVFKQVNFLKPDRDFISSDSVEDVKPLLQRNGIRVRLEKKDERLQEDDLIKSLIEDAKKRPKK